MFINKPRGTGRKMAKLKEKASQLSNHRPTTICWYWQLGRSVSWLASGQYTHGGWIIPDMYQGSIHKLLSFWKMIFVLSGMEAFADVWGGLHALNVRGWHVEGGVRLVRVLNSIRFIEFGSELKLTNYGCLHSKFQIWVFTFKYH